MQRQARKMVLLVLLQQWAACKARLCDLESSGLKCRPIVLTGKEAASGGCERVMEVSLH